MFRKTVATGSGKLKLVVHRLKEKEVFFLLYLKNFIISNCKI